MTCDEYLAMLATASLGQLEAQVGRDHAARCLDCDRVTRLVAERERRRAAAYGELRAAAPARATGAVALLTARERRVDRIWAVGIALALAAVVWLAASRVPVGARAAKRPAPRTSDLVEATFSPRCLTVRQAVELVRPHLASREAWIVAGGRAPGVLRVGGTPAQIEAAREAIARTELDVSACERPPHVAR